MTKGFLAKQSRALNAKLKDCLKQQTRASRGLAAIGGDGQKDTADLANALLEQEVTLRRANGCADEIFNVSQAILNIKKGAYGICVTCREQIAIKRLRAIPFATECIDCKKDEEKSRK